MDQKLCPFCIKSFRCLGSHLAHCPARHNQPYHQYLAQNTGKASLTQNEPNPLKKYPTCGSSFKRLDVHFRWNAAFRDPLADKLSLDHQFQQPQHRELSSDAKPAQQQQSTLQQSTEMNQHVQHTRNFHQCIHYTFESSVPQGDSPHHPQLKPALKLR